MSTQTHDSVPPPAYTPTRITSGQLPISYATLDVPDSVLPLVLGSYTLVLAVTPQGRSPFGVELCDTQGRHRGWVHPDSSWDVMRLLDEGEAVGCVLTYRGAQMRGGEEAGWRSAWIGSVSWWVKQGGDEETKGKGGGRGNI